LVEGVLLEEGETPLLIATREDSVKLKNDGDKHIKTNKSSKNSRNSKVSQSSHNFRVTPDNKNRERDNMSGGVIRDNSLENLKVDTSIN